jgi:peptidoglycan/xylan/chitin deacetylase (PgdA/CDA1 family)
MSRKKIALVSNICIAVVLIGLGIAVFTADLTNLFISVSAPVQGGGAEGRNVALMFVVEDDADRKKGERFDLDETLRILKETETPATFFIGGNWASKNIAKVLEIAADFEIGNHAYSNSPLAKMNEKAQFQEISAGHGMLKQITSSVDGRGQATGEGADLRFFLPPFGSFNKKTLKSAERLGYRTVMWSRDATSGVIYDQAIGGVLPGEFILMRPFMTSNAALAGVIRDLRGMKGLNIVSVGQALAL